MNWVQRKIYLYNVTFGLYMLDWWERYLFNTLVLVLMWFIFYNSSRYISESYKKDRYCKRADRGRVFPLMLFIWTDICSEEWRVKFLYRDKREGMAEEL